MPPRLVHTHNSPEHPHVAGTVDGVIPPDGLDRLTLSEPTVHLNLDLSRLIRWLGRGDYRRHRVEEYVAILHGVCDGIAFATFGRLEVSFRKLLLESGSPPRVGESKVRVKVFSTGSGTDLARYDETEKLWKRLESLDILETPQDRSPLPTA